MAKGFLYAIRGSLALINLVACAFFAPSLGSPMATTAAIGKVMYPRCSRMVHMKRILHWLYGIGLITPPFGACLFVASGLDRSVKLESIYKRIIPFCLAAFVGGLIITFVPSITLWFK